MIAAEEQPVTSRAARGSKPQPPAWLQLEHGEELLVSYPGKQIAEVVIYATLAVLGLCIATALVVLILGKGGKDVAGILTSVGGTISGLSISLGQLKKTQLHVTNKMLIFAQGKKAAGVPLGDVAAIRPGDGSRWTIGIYTRGNPKAVGKITVLETERVAAELTEYCQRGGARLMAEPQR